MTRVLKTITSTYILKKEPKIDKCYYAFHPSFPWKRLDLNYTCLTFTFSHVFQTRKTEKNRNRLEFIRTNDRTKSKNCLTICVTNKSSSIHIQPLVNRINSSFRSKLTHFNEIIGKDMQTNNKTDLSINESFTERN